MKMTLTEIYKQTSSIDVLIGWPGPDLIEAGCAVAYISGSNDLCVRGAITEDILGVEDMDCFELYADCDFLGLSGFAIYIDNIDNECSDDVSNWWRVWRPGFMGSTALPLTMYRGSERIGDAVLFELSYAGD